MSTLINKVLILTAYVLLSAPGMAYEWTPAIELEDIKDEIRTLAQYTMDSPQNNAELELEYRHTVEAVMFRLADLEEEEFHQFAGQGLENMRRKLEEIRDYYFHSPHNSDWDHRKIVIGKGLMAALREIESPRRGSPAEAIGH